MHSLKIMLAGLVLAVLALATPALAEEVPISTTPTASLECTAQAVNDFRSAWQQQTGNPYYDSYDASPKNGLPDTIESTWAVQAAARGCTFRKSAAPVAVTAPDPAAIAQAKRDGAAAVKAAVTAAMAGL